MQHERDTTITNSSNELRTVLTAAAQISRENQLKEVCSEALLLAILEQEAAAAAFLKLGFNVFMFKRVLAKKLATKAADKSPKELPYSLAVDGLLILNAMEKNAPCTALHLLKTIVRYHNTAAARMLRNEQIYLNEFNRLIYKTY